MFPRWVIPISLLDFAFFCDVKCLFYFMSAFLILLVVRISQRVVEFIY